ncbi:MAG: hypothetical protein A2Z18_02385 [Armatimonadetes bacterium RBG_16_58_9]|nr:MAG: hypothetical protein A2Z18_02385 [Armatimonadetes bacterium RBG_16_58_9]
MEAELRKSGLEYRLCNDVEEAIAQRLAGGRVGARFNGRMESAGRANLAPSEARPIRSVGRCTAEPIVERAQQS